MITSIRLGNARIFEGQGWDFPLDQMSVICGTNSAGKSTLLKTILLLRQSLGIGGSLRSNTPRLKFVGSEVDLGDFATFISHKDRSRDLHIGMTVPGDMQPDVADLLRNQKTDASSPKRGPEPFNLSCDFTFGYYGSSDDVPRLDLPRPDAQDEEEGADGKLPEQAALLKEARFQIDLADGVRLAWQVFVAWARTDDTLRAYSIRLPRSYVEGASGLQGISIDPKNTDLAEFPTLVRGMLPDRIIGRAADAPADAPDEAAVKLWPLPVHVERAHRTLRLALSNTSYLGPIRYPARRFYTLESEVPFSDLGGESLPNFLHERSNVSVVNLHEGASIRRESLSRALDGWLYYLRAGTFCNQFTRELSVTTIRDVLIQMDLRTIQGTEIHALADSGFGYSQVLPILARGLMVSPGGTLVVEQPELHLNPALQVRVAKFLTCMARAGKQVLIETHSEHIVNAIRVLAAEEEDEQITKLCRILFIDSQSEKRPTLHELSIQGDGTVPDWPKSFFGEAASLAGRLLRVQVKQRQAGS